MGKLKNRKEKGSGQRVTAHPQDVNSSNVHASTARTGRLQTSTGHEPLKPRAPRTCTRAPARRVLGTVHALTFASVGAACVGVALWLANDPLTRYTQPAGLTAGDVAGYMHADARAGDTGCPGSANSAHAFMTKVLHPVPPADFFSHTYNQRPAVLHGQALDFTGLLPKDIFQDLLLADPASSADRLTGSLPWRLGTTVALARTCAIPAPEHVCTHALACIGRPAWCCSAHVSKPRLPKSDVSCDPLAAHVHACEPPTHRATETRSFLPAPCTMHHARPMPCRVHQTTRQGRPRGVARHGRRWSGCRMMSTTTPRSTSTATTSTPSGSCTTRATLSSLTNCTSAAHGAVCLRARTCAWPHATCTWFNCCRRLLTWFNMLPMPAHVV